MNNQLILNPHSNKKPAHPRKNRSQFWQLAILTFLGFIIPLLLHTDPALAQSANSPGLNPQIWLRNALEWIDGLGTVGAIAFIGIYIIATVAFLPGFILTVGAGAIFKVVWGSIYVFVGATIGATAAFLIGRYLARSWVTKKIAGNTKFRVIDEAVGREGLKIVLLTRLSPVFPFNVLNYAYGLTGVSLKNYFFASIGMLPGTIMYVYIGSLFGNLAELFAGVNGRAKTPAEYALYIFGLFITIVLTVYITKIAKKALEESTEVSEINDSV